MPTPKSIDVTYLTLFIQVILFIFTVGGGFAAFAVVKTKLDFLIKSFQDHEQQDRKDFAEIRGDMKATGATIDTRFDGARREMEAKIEGAKELAAQATLRTTTLEGRVDGLVHRKGAT